MIVRKHKLVGLICLAVLGLIIGACANPGLGSISGLSAANTHSGTGSLKLYFGESESRTLQPIISMDSTSYSITGTGPNGASFTQTTNAANCIVNDLLVGNWTFDVQALNHDGILIGDGRTQVLISVGMTINATITIGPIAGPGTLDLMVTWPPIQNQTPSISAKLTPALGAPLNLGFTLNSASGQARYTNTNLPNGYSTLTLQLLNSGISVMGAVEIVRIVAGQTTAGTFSFTNLEQPVGTLQTTIVDHSNPLVVALSGTVANTDFTSPQICHTTTNGVYYPQIDQVNPLYLSATVSNYSGTSPLIYVWYVNGVNAATGQNFVFDDPANAYLPGYYRIDVTAFTGDGSQAGSTTTNVQVVPSIQVETFTLDTNHLSLLLGNIPSGPSVPGSYRTLVANVYPVNADNPLKWSSDDPNIVNVDQTGLVIASTPPTPFLTRFTLDTHITAATQDASNISQQVSVTVTPVLIDSISIPAAADLQLNGISYGRNPVTSALTTNTLTIVPAISPSYAYFQTLLWGDPGYESIASVGSTNGIVNAIGTGADTLIKVVASAIDGTLVSTSCNIKIHPKLVSSFELISPQSAFWNPVLSDPTAIPAPSPPTQDFTVQYQPWDAFNPKISSVISPQTTAVSISPFGKIVIAPNNEGTQSTTTIAAKALCSSSIINFSINNATGPGGILTIPVTIKIDPKEITGLSITPLTIDCPLGNQYILNATITPLDAYYKSKATINWILSSSDGAVSLSTTSGFSTTLLTQHVSTAWSLIFAIAYDPTGKLCAKSLTNTINVVP